MKKQLFSMKASWWSVWSSQGLLFLMFKSSYFKVLRRIVNLLALKDPEFPESNMFWKCVWVIGCQIWLLNLFGPPKYDLRKENQEGKKKKERKFPLKQCPCTFFCQFRNHLKCYFHHITFHHVFASSWPVRAYMFIPAMPFT